VESHCREAEVEIGISRARLSLLERGIMLTNDEWVPALAAFYGAPPTRWYVHLAAWSPAWD